MPNETGATIDPDVGKSLTQQETEEAFAVPAFLSNRFFIHPVASGVRVAFGEQPPGSENNHFRVAVLLSHPDAVQLYRLLQHMVGPHEAELAEQDGNAERQKDG